MTNGVTTMKLEAGKHYRTRDGRKAYVAAVATPEQVACSTSRAFGWCDGVAHCWHDDGRYLASIQGPCDLIEEWREPRKFTRDVFVYDDGYGHERWSVCASACLKLLARTTIELTEGEGL